MARSKLYTIRLLMTEKDMQHLVNALKKHGGAISDDLVSMIARQKRTQDEESEGGE